MAPTPGSLSSLCTDCRQASACRVVARVLSSRKRVSSASRTAGFAFANANPGDDDSCCCCINSSLLPPLLPLLLLEDGGVGTPLRIQARYSATTEEMPAISACVLKTAIPKAVSSARIWFASSGLLPLGPGDGGGDVVVVDDPFRFRTSRRLGTCLCCEKMLSRRNDDEDVLATEIISSV